MKRSKKAAKKLKLDTEEEAEEVQPSKEEKKAKKAAKEGKKSGKEAKDAKKKPKSPERAVEEAQPQISRASRKMEKGRKAQQSPSPIAGTSQQTTPTRTKKKPAKHLERPRTPSPEAYESSDADSYVEDSPRTTVVHEEVDEPEVVSKDKGGSGSKPRKKWRKLTELEEDALVQYYLENPIFYDKSHDDFLNRELKRRMRDEKGAAMKLDGTYIDPMAAMNIIPEVFAEFIRDFSLEIDDRYRIY